LYGHVNSILQNILDLFFDVGGDGVRAVEWGIWIDSVCVQLPLVPYTYYRGDQRVLCISLALVFLRVDVLINLDDAA
jgi:hypothetical protein